MPSEGEFVSRGKNPHVIVAPTLRRKQKSRVRIIHLASYVLHSRIIEAQTVGEHRQLVATESLLRKYIRDHKPFAVFHFNLRFNTIPIRLMPSSIISGF